METRTASSRATCVDEERVACSRASNVPFVQRQQLAASYQEVQTVERTTRVLICYEPAIDA